MDNCYFCGANAPNIVFNKGIYSMTCSCGNEIFHPDKTMVILMWNYMKNKEKYPD